MNIVLFAILGALVNAPWWYWVAYGVGTFISVSTKVLKVAIKISKINDENS